MGKLADDTVLDASLQEIIDKADKLVLLEGEPADYADATTLKGSGGHKLGDVAVTSGDFPSIVDNTGAAGGRKIPSFTESVTPDESGAADHYAFVDDGGSVLLYVDTMTQVSVSAGEQQSVEVGEIINEDPT